MAVSTRRMERGRRKHQAALRNESPGGRGGRVVAAEVRAKQAAQRIAMAGAGAILIAG